MFEKQIERKVLGVYYTPNAITEHLCAGTIHKLILDRIAPSGSGSIEELLPNLDAFHCRKLLREILPDLKLLDPACGSGAFLIAALKTLEKVYRGVIGRIELLKDAGLKRWLSSLRAQEPSIDFYIRKRIITENLFGVDIMEEAVETARLRLFLTLLASVPHAEQLKPLPRIDFNIRTGHALLGLLRVDGSRMKETLNELLLREFRGLGIKFERAAWDAEGKQEGRPTKRELTLQDIEALRPFHWGFEFRDVIDRKGGFDAVITNPPWEVLKPNAKEFFAEHSALIKKNRMTVSEFAREQARLLENVELRGAWLAYKSLFHHQALYYRKASQYRHQVSLIRGRKQGVDINLFKLFTEQCFNLLREGGRCGIVLPSGIYTDLGTRQLREMLFTRTRVTGLVGFENRRLIFQGVDARFKFAVLTFIKGGKTENFPAIFMRHSVEELQSFPKDSALRLSVELIRKISPDSFSIMEFRNEMDVRIAEKMLRHPLLGQRIEGAWNLILGREFHMTDDSRLFKSVPARGSLPLYEGRMIHHFNAGHAAPRFWINEAEGRAALSCKDEQARPDYQEYRIGFRAIARSTDVRTIIVGPIPPNVFCGNSLFMPSRKNSTPRDSFDAELLAVQALLNSFTVDFYARRMVTANVNMFYVYQLPIPRLTKEAAAFSQIVERAARLVCTTREFDGLAREVGMKDHTEGVTDGKKRALLRAELDATVARLYDLTEAEFRYVLSTFPLVDRSAKELALRCFRRL